MNIVFTRQFAIFAVQKLALIDYDVATKVSEKVADVSTWSYNHNLPLFAIYSIDGLDMLDKFGSMLIAIVVFIIHHTS